ncbi:MAG TPA: hypothetical protein VMU19_05480, partial [Bryobacteraceae bacterium]|nr:hypothetical protein [Bryobacteraceae bacterium]
SLPHYSACKFWIAAGMACICMALCFFAFAAAGRASRAIAPRRWWWLAVSAGAMAASAMAYEVGIPILIGVPVILYLRTSSAASRAGSAGWFRSRSLAPALALAAVWFAVVVFKAATQSSFSIPAESASLAPLLRRSFHDPLFFNLGSAALGLPWLAFRLLARTRNLAVLVSSAALAGVVALHVFAITRGGEAPLCSKRRSLGLIALGAGVFAVGYSLFDLWGFDFTDFAGIDSRFTVGSAVGTAILMAGCFMLVSASISARARSLALALLVGLYCGSGLVATSAIAGAWKDAAVRQRAVLGALQAGLPHPAPGTTILLDGVCTAAGPVPFLHGGTDVTGALRVLYRDPTLSGNLITPDYSLSATSLRALQGDYEVYPLGPKLVLYNFARREIRLMADWKTSGQALSLGNFANPACPPVTAGLMALHY